MGIPLANTGRATNNPGAGCIPPGVVPRLTLLDMAPPVSYTRLTLEPGECGDGMDVGVPHRAEVRAGAALCDPLQQPRRLGPTSSA